MPLGMSTTGGYSLSIYPTPKKFCKSVLEQSSYSHRRTDIIHSTTCGHTVRVRSMPKHLRESTSSLPWQPLLSTDALALAHYCNQSSGLEVQLEIHAHGSTLTSHQLRPSCIKPWRALTADVARSCHAPNCALVQPQQRVLNQLRATCKSGCSPAPLTVTWVHGEIGCLHSHMRRRYAMKVTEGMSSIVVLSCTSLD